MLGNPTDPDNGAYTVTGTAGGDTATVECDENYVASADTIVCQYDDTWTVATCDAGIDCGTPSDPEGGAYTVSGTTPGETATLACGEGYNDPDTTTITCEEAGNWDAILTCILIIDCGDLSDPEYGTYSTPTDTLEDATAILTCEQGRFPGGDKDASTTVTCGSDGDWEGALTCAEPAMCLAPTFDLGYEAVDDTSIGLLQGDPPVEVQCSEFYEGEPEPIVCRADATWSPLRNCTYSTQFFSAAETSSLSMANVMFIGALLLFTRA